VPLQTVPSAPLYCDNPQESLFTMHITDTLADGSLRLLFHWHEQSVWIAEFCADTVPVTTPLVQVLGPK